MSICNDSLGSILANRRLLAEKTKVEASQLSEHSQPVTTKLVGFVPFGYPPETNHVTWGQAFEALQCFDAALRRDSNHGLLQAAQRLVDILDSENNPFKGIELPKHFKEALEAARTVLGSRPAVSD